MFLGYLGGLFHTEGDIGSETWRMGSTFGQSRDRGRVSGQKRNPSPSTQGDPHPDAGVGCVCIPQRKGVQLLIAVCPEEELWASSMLAVCLFGGEISGRTQAIQVSSILLRVSGPQQRM